MKSFMEIEKQGMIDTLDDLLMYGLIDHLAGIGAYQRNNSLAEYGPGCSAELDYRTGWEGTDPDAPAIIAGIMELTRYLTEEEKNGVREKVLADLAEFKPEKVEVSHLDTDGGEAEFFRSGPPVLEVVVS